jgi:hypothetical protein
VFVLAVFFHKTVSDPATAAAGLFSAVLGLVLFLDGLRLAVMPMAMQVTQLHSTSIMSAPASALLPSMRCHRPRCCNTTGCKQAPSMSRQAGSST